MVYATIKFYKFGGSQGAIQFLVRSRNTTLHDWLVPFGQHFFWSLLRIICALFSVVVFAWIAGNAMADDKEAIWNYVYNIINPVLHVFWLVLSSDLIKDRHIDDDSARFEFECEPITICQFVKQPTNLLHFA